MTNTNETETERAVRRAAILCARADWRRGISDASLAFSSWRLTALLPAYRAVFTSHYLSVQGSLDRDAAVRRAMGWR